MINSCSPLSEPVRKADLVPLALVNVWLAVPSARVAGQGRAVVALVEQQHRHLAAGLPRVQRGAVVDAAQRVAAHAIARHADCVQKYLRHRCISQRCDRIPAASRMVMSCTVTARVVRERARHAPV